jgi:hypothetical protein
VTDKNGSLDLKDLPPGTYTITVRQEKVGASSQKTTVGVGDTKTLDFASKQCQFREAGSRGIRIGPGSVSIAS